MRHTKGGFISEWQPHATAHPGFITQVDVTFLTCSRTLDVVDDTPSLTRNVVIMTHLTLKQIHLPFKKKSLVFWYNNHWERGLRFFGGIFIHCDRVLHLFFCTGPRLLIITDNITTCLSQLQYQPTYLLKHYQKCKSGKKIKTQTIYYCL